MPALQVPPFFVRHHVKERERKESFPFPSFLTRGEEKSFTFCVFVCTSLADPNVILFHYTTLIHHLLSHVSFVTSSNSSDSSRRGDDKIMIPFSAHLSFLFLVISSSLAADDANKKLNTTTEASPATTSTTTPSTIIQIVPLPSTAKTAGGSDSKNETLKALAQSPYGQGIGPFGGNSPLPPQLVAALQRRQQLLSQQSEFEQEIYPPSSLILPFPVSNNEIRILHGNKLCTPFLLPHHPFSASLSLIHVAVILFNMLMLLLANPLTRVTSCSHPPVFSTDPMLRL